MSVGIFEPTFVKSSCSMDAVVKELDEYENGLNERAVTLKNSGKTVGDQDFECCSFSFENSGNSHLLLLGGMGPMAGVYGMRDALKTCGDNSSVTLFQACKMPKRAAETDITPMLKNAVKSALEYCPKEKNIKLVVLCNGAHRFMKNVLDDEIKNKVEFCSLRESVEKNTKMFEGKKSVALQTLFSAQNCIYGYTHTLRSLHEIPELAKLQTDLTSAIEGVKSFDEHKVIKNAANVFETLKKWGAQKLLLGCTELPVIMDYLNWQVEGIELINPLHLVLSEIKNEVCFE